MHDPIENSPGALTQWASGKVDGVISDLGMLISNPLMSKHRRTCSSLTHEPGSCLIWRRWGSGMVQGNELFSNLQLKVLMIERKTTNYNAKNHDPVWAQLNETYNQKYREPFLVKKQNKKTNTNISYLNFISLLEHWKCCCSVCFYPRFIAFALCDYRVTFSGGRWQDAGITWFIRGTFMVGWEDFVSDRLYTQGVIWMYLCVWEIL